MDNETHALRLGVDTGSSADSIEKVGKKLDELGEKGQKAQRAMKQTGEAAAQEMRDMTALAESINPVLAQYRRLDEQQEKLARAYKKGLTDTDTFKELNMRIDEARAKLGGLEEAQDRANFSKLIANIDPARAAMNRLSETAEELKARLASGDINASEYQRYAANVNKAMSDVKRAGDTAGRQIDELRSKYDPLGQRMQALERDKANLDRQLSNRNIGIEEHSRLTKALDSETEALRRQEKQVGANTISAGQLRMANQMLPAQFTDIVVSLQGGQRPLTVLLQQGGQIKDMYGGVGAALKATASYAAGLVNPLTVSVAAVGALGYAAYSASTRFNELNKQMIIGGHSSREELAAMQAQAVAMTNTIHGISEATAGNAIATVAANGKIAFSDLNEVATASLEVQRSTGQEIEKTASEYASLADGGEKALLKLNDKYNFLDEAQFRHISGLYRIGKETEAADQAQHLYLENLKRVAAEAEQNLTPLEKAWRGIKEAAIEAGNQTAIAFGLGTKLQKMKADLRQASSPWTDGGYLFGTNQNAARRTWLKANIDLQEGANQALAKGAGNKDHRDENDKIAKQNDLLEKNYTKRQRVAAERTKFENQLKDSGMDQADIDKQLRQYDENHKEKGHKRRDRHSNMGDNMLEQAREQGAALEAQIREMQNGVAQMSEADKALAKFEERVKNIKAKGKREPGDDNLLRNEQAIRVQLQDNALAAEGVRVAKERLDLIKKQAQQHEKALDAIEKINKATDSRRLTQGMGDVRAQRETEINNIKGDKELSLEDQQKKIDAVRNGYAQIDAAQMDWRNGATAAWDDFNAQQMNVAKGMREGMTSCFASATDSLVTFVKTGELSFKSLLDTAADAAIKIGMQYAMMSAFGGGGGGGFLGGLGGLFGGGDAPVKRAGGGMVYGPGTSTSDSVPALLSNREFVVNADATQRHRGLLEAINSGKMPQFARGGAVDGSSVSVSSSHQGGSVTFGDIHVTANSAEEGKEAASAIMDEVQRLIDAGRAGAVADARVMLQNETNRSGGMIHNLVNNRR